MIFYFSGTGNTRWAAFRIAAVTHDQLVDIAEVMRRMKASDKETSKASSMETCNKSGNASNFSFTLKEGERIGFVFPVHGWRVPKLFRDFIAQLNIVSETETDSPFTYAVCTAGDSIGLTIDNLNKAICANRSLQALGIPKVMSAYSLIMPESYVGLPFMDVDPQEKEKRKKEKAAHDLDEYIGEIVDRKEGSFRLVKGVLPWLMTQVVGGFFEHVLITDKRFHVTQEKCVKCGICAHVCPVQDIEGGKGSLPKWLHHKDCLTCFSCYHHCPHHAIEFGHQTQKKGQYYYR